MIYIFEDSPKSVLSQLYQKCYSEDTDIVLDYSYGRGNLWSRIKFNLKESKDKIVVFVDMIPDNIDTYNTYRNLTEIYENENRDRLIVLPIVCAEYYFIKSVKDNDRLIIDKESIQMCIDKYQYYNSRCIKNEEDKKSCRSFEKYCKFVVKRCLKRCMTDNKGYDSMYMKIDCNTDCKYFNNCDKVEILSKSIAYIKSYPIYPVNKLLADDTDTNKLGFNDLYKIKDKLIDEYDYFTSRMEDSSYRNINYKYIKEYRHAKNKS